MAAAVLTEPKKTFINAEHNHRDGLTGMGWHTKKHFISVQQKMRNYVGGQKEEFEYDQKHLHSQPIHPALLDGKRATKPQAQILKPITAHKSLAHLGLATPKPDQRHRKFPLKPSAK